MRARRVERPAGHDELLARFMPDFDIIERHAIHVDAPADRTYAAACQVDMQRSRVIRAIIRGRELMMRSRAAVPPRARGLLVDALAMGWGRLAEIPDREVVMGAITKPWEPDPAFHALAPDAFAAFREPGWVKIGWTLRADPDIAGSIARTETRAVATDPVAQARFRHYWRRVWPGIVLIRHVLLRLVKRDAERQYRSQ
jgi:hypothetical protein